MQTLQNSSNDAIATRPVEAEETGSGGIQIAREGVAEECPGPEETSPNRGRRNAQAFRGFGDGHVLDIAHHEHHAEACRQAVDFPLENASNLAAQHRIGRRFRLTIGDVAGGLFDSLVVSGRKWDDHAVRA